MEEKKSFFGSVMDGIGGFIKGALAGGAVGVIAGAAIAAVGALIFPGAAEAFLGGFIPEAAGQGIATLGITGASALTGATLGGMTMGAVGGYSGMATEVVRGREATQVSGEDVANVAKISYAQGMMVGHNIAQEQQTGASNKFRDKIAQERAARATQQQQMH